MFYTISKNSEGKYCVYKADADGNPIGERIACHDTQDGAAAQIGAIEHAEKQRKAWSLRQSDVNYVAVSVKKGEACANCRWFNPYGDWRDDVPIASCHIIQNWPDAILATGYCNRHEAVPAMRMEPAPMPVVIVEPEEEGEGMMDMGKAAAPARPGVIERIFNAFRHNKPTRRGGFKALGNGLWVAWYTNNFEDREKEILSEGAHDHYVARLDMALVPMPELWFWHIPGSAHGKAQWVERIDHMMVAAGRFADTPLSKAFQKHYASGVEYAVSHGFNADKERHLKDGVWIDYNTFEISPLPLQAAANPFTLFTGVDAMLTEQKLAALESIVGKEMAAEIVAKSKDWSKEIEELGARYKEFVDPARLKAPAPETAALEAISKNVGPLLVDLTESQGELLSMVSAMSKKQDAASEAYKAELKPLQDRIAQLEAQLNLTPRRASQAAETQLSEAEAKALEGSLPGQQYDPFFGDMKVPAKR